MKQAVRRPGSTPGGDMTSVTLEPDGQATGCNPVQVGSTPTGVSVSSRAVLKSAPPFLSLDIINAKALVCNKEHRDISVSACAMRHDLSFREPDESAWTKSSLVGYQLAFENIQAVTARVGVPGIHKAGSVSNEPDLCPGLRVNVEILQDGVDLTIIPMSNSGSGVPQIKRRRSRSMPGSPASRS